MDYCTMAGTAPATPVQPGEDRGAMTSRRGQRLRFAGGTAVLLAVVLTTSSLAAASPAAAYASAPGAAPATSFAMTPGHQPSSLHRTPSSVPAVGVSSHPTAGSKGAAVPADVPSGQSWVVSLGDSYVSGEAGRWAGNINGESSQVDALGPTAYFDDNGTGESIAGCHRSSSAEIYFGAATYGKNLACSGSQTGSSVLNGQYKPGLDFDTSNPAGVGQAQALEDFATTHRVKMLVVGIGGDDFDFGGIVQTCVEDYIAWAALLPFASQDHCSDDPGVTGHFTSAAMDTTRGHIVQGLQNLRLAMTLAGYGDGDYTIVVQTYPSPLSTSAHYRYPEAQVGLGGLVGVRQSTGGCGIFDADADWANNVAVPDINSTLRGAVAASGLTNVQTLDVTSLFDGHRLCENADNTMDATSYTNWQQAGWSDAAEWVNMIRALTTVGSSPYYLQESLHPNYFGQLALRDCLRQVYNFGFVQGGTCVQDGNGLDTNGEQKTRLIIPLAPRHCSVIQAPVAQGVTTAAAPAATFTNYANHTPDGWTGADSTFSVGLPDGRIVWLFSDTFLGPINPDGVSRP